MGPNPPDFELDCCRRRQGRLLERMSEMDVELVVSCDPLNVQWLTGARYLSFFRPVATVKQDGEVALVVPVNQGDSPPQGFAANRIVPYEGQSMATMRPDQGVKSAAAMLDALGHDSLPERVAVEYSACAFHWLSHLCPSPLDIEPTFQDLRRKKEPDELRMMSRSVDAHRAMYRKAREIVRPGINELQVYWQLHAAAVEELRESPTYFGQDFQCGTPGGPPRDREAEDGELYILDLGIGYRGYFADTSRTFCVGKQPTDSQQRAWEAIMPVFEFVESTVKPGASCRQVYDQVLQMLSPSQPWSFFHHLGHGLGLNAHEAPFLNPNWDDVFEAGNVFTVEPGLYHQELRGGIRLEQNYLVTDSGVERLTDFPLEL